jgi:hypothetical protein
MLKSIVASAVVAGTSAIHWSQLSEEYTYSQWLEEYKPQHEGSEEVFKANLAEIMEHNTQKSSWKAGVNQVSK